MGASASPLQSERKAVGISEALVIAATPAAAYLITFVYERGFGIVFGIPSQFIVPNLTNVLVVTGSLVFIGLFMFAAASLILIFLPNIDTPVNRRVAIVLPLVVVFAAYLLLYEEKWREWLPALPPLLILIFLAFIAPLLVHRKEPRWIDRFAAADRHRPKTRTVFDDVMARLAPVALDCAIYAWMALMVAYHAGRSEALWERVFLVTSTTPEMVVLRIYGDNLIAAPFDRQRKTVQRSFVILKLTDTKGVLRLESVGPLASETCPCPRPAP